MNLGIDPQVAFDKLTQFQTADELANYFRQEGITGNKSGALSCPIAQYMQRHTQNSVYVSLGYIGTTNDTWLVKNSEPLVDFIRRFDSGLYPDLEDRNW